MKKLLVTVIGAAAAYGASAGLISTQRFESATISGDAVSISNLNTLAGGEYWSDGGSTNNVYKIGGVSELGGIASQPTPLGTPAKALDVATRFGEPLTVKIGSDGEDIGSGLYFDSLVKFTACDSEPEDRAAYDGAKIMMWLQTNDDETETYLKVKAGYLSYDDGVKATNKTYTCDVPEGFDASKFNRVTIKAIRDISTSGYVVPAFAIYINGSTDGTSAKLVKCSADKWDSSFAENITLTEAATDLNSATKKGLFPSMVQNGTKDTLVSVGFDGTGAMTDLAFTDVAPKFAEDHVDPEINEITIAGEKYTTLADAITAVNGQNSGSFTLSLAKDMTLTETLAFASAANVVLDFAGKVLTIAGTTPAISNAGLLTITNSSDTVGGIECTASEGGVAVTDNGSGMLNFAGGFFKGHVDLDDAGTYSVYGGSFKDDETNFEYVEDEETKTWIAEGKKLEYNRETGLYDIVENAGTVIKVALTWGDFTPVSCTVNGESVTPAAEIDAEDGNEVVLTVENADGVQKSYSLTVSAETENNAIDASTWVPAWADYLGEAVAGAFQIDDGADLIMFQKGVLAGLATANVTFKQTANIDMTGVEGFWGIGWFTSSDAKDASITASGDIKFEGTYDGQGYTIANVTIVKHNYAGIFNCIGNATVKDLTVSNVTFSGTCNEEGFAVVGNSYGNSTIANVTSAGTWPASMRHNSAGIAVRAQHNTVITGCVNNVSFSTTSKRLGGILAFSEDPASASEPGVQIIDCVNYGNLSSTDGTRGVAGILSRSEASSDKTTIRGCANFGTLAAGSSGFTGAIVGQLDSNTYTDDGGNTFPASQNMVGDYKGKTVNGIAYAIASTIDNVDYLTTVKKADLAAGNTYKLLADVGNEVVFTLASAGDTIAFDSNGFTFGGTVEVGEGLYTKTATSGSVTTYTASAFDWEYYLGAAVNGAYEIDDLTELKAFQANVGTLATVGLTFKLTADIALDAAWAGIGIANGKDLVTGTDAQKAQFDAGAFQGTFDGQNHTISAFQMVGVADNPANNGEGLDYAGFFNSVYGATIQNLKIQYDGALFAVDSAAGTKESGATFVGVAKNSTLVNLTSLQKDSSTSVTISKGFGGIVGYLMGSTVDSCTNNVSATSLNVKNNVTGNKVGGIAMICQQSGCSIVNCVNNGTPNTGSNEFGGILAYTDAITISNCQNTAACKMFYHHGGTVTLVGENKGNATVEAYTGVATPGLNFATVDGNVATFVADNALASNNTYKVMAAGATATYAFGGAGTIAFDTNLVQNVTFAITAAEGLTLTPATVGTVTTYTAAEPSTPEVVPGGDPVVVDESKTNTITTAVIQPPTKDAETYTPAEVTAYQSLFKVTFTPQLGGSGFVVGAELDESLPAVQAVVEDLTDAVETIPLAGVVAGDDDATVEINAVPGLYYGVATGTTLENMAVSTWKQAKTGNTKLTLDVPAKGESQAAGFYRIEASATGK